MTKLVFFRYNNNSFFTIKKKTRIFESWFSPDVFIRWPK